MPQARLAGRDVKILGDIQGPKFRCSLTEGDVPVPLPKGQVVEFGLCMHEDDLTRPGRITLTPTTEQTALVRQLPSLTRTRSRTPVHGPSPQHAARGPSLDSRPSLSCQPARPHGSGSSGLAPVWSRQADRQAALSDWPMDPHH